MFVTRLLPNFFILLIVNCRKIITNHNENYAGKNCLSLTYMQVDQVDCFKLSSMRTHIKEKLKFSSLSAIINISITQAQEKTIL